MGYNPGDGLNLQLQVTIQPNIGLDENTRQVITQILNDALSDEVILTIKTRSLYWNIHGVAFFELRTLFGAQYQQLCDLSDEIAERARMLGGVALGSLQVFLEHTRLTEQTAAVPDTVRLLADHEAIIRFLREDAKKCVEEYEDEGTHDLLVRAIRLHEKMAWMLRSYVEI
ncbi:MAG: DNA starvation/stationary phase protection protein [Chloroflexi bacterium]|nr:DNA starvation/stationary phase protection protein [Chloroflexota bacterium]